MGHDDAAPLDITLRNMIVENGDTLVACLALMLFMYFHNKHRLGSGYLSHLLVIFVVLQLFPPLVAGLILFIFHSRDLLLLQKCMSQHKPVVQIEKSSQQPGKVTVSVLGIAEEDARHCTMETIIEEKEKEGAITRSSIVTAKGSPLSTTVSFNSSSTCRVKVVQEDTKRVLIDTVVTLA